jgi:hypothetical protein
MRRRQRFTGLAFGTARFSVTSVRQAVLNTFLTSNKMGMWFSLPNDNKETLGSARVLPESIKTEPEKIMIRHRPTCLSTDIESGLAESQENAPAINTNPA